LSDIVLQGQYKAGTIDGEAVPGYLEEEGVAPQSRTNTFACLKLMTRSARWEGVPFYLRSGKRLERKETRISIQFQEPSPVGEGASPNCMEFILQGEAGMRIHLQTKLGGTEPAFRPLVTFSEVQAAWRLLDPLQTYLDDPSTPLHTYLAGSRGPEEANEWIGKDELEWQ